VKNKFSYAYSQEFPYRTNHILECEFYLLENLDCCLIVYQPYRPLLQLIQDIGQEDQLLALAWRVVNDSLRTDVCLLYPPYQIALGEWFLEGDVSFSWVLCTECLKWLHNWEVVSVVHLKNYLFLFLFYIHISSACHLLPGICGCASFWFIMHSIKYGCHEEAQLLLDWHTSNEI